MVTQVGVGSFFTTKACYLVSFGGKMLKPLLPLLLFDLLKLDPQPVLFQTPPINSRIF